MKYFRYISIFRRSAGTWTLGIFLVLVTLFCVSGFVNTSAPVTDLYEMSDIPEENISVGGQQTGTDISSGKHHHRRHHHIARRRSSVLFFFGTQTVNTTAHSDAHHIRLKIGYCRALVRTVRPFYYTFLYRYTLF
ncbi:MAG: hypothetical protein JNM41_09075 [Flavipsychrobacter sp.]|nr:hypothetical protein [Flavipsychrobacter sp.]